MKICFVKSEIHTYVQDTRKVSQLFRNFSYNFMNVRQKFRNCTKKIMKRFPTFFSVIIQNQSRRKSRIISITSCEISKKYYVSCTLWLIKYCFLDVRIYGLSPSLRGLCRNKTSMRETVEMVGSGHIKMLKDVTYFSTNQPIRGLKMSKK